VYLVPLLASPLLVVAARRVPESRRFAAAASSAPRHRRLVDRRRLALLGVTFFLTALFATPASQLQNEYLKDHRGFSGAGITAYTLITATPAGISVLLGGRFSDVLGRRVLAATGILGGTLFVVLHFGAEGYLLWLTGFLGLFLSGLSVSSMGSYGPELFATRARGRATGLVHGASVAGSV